MISGTTSAAAGDGSGMPSGPITSLSLGDQARKVSDWPRAFTDGSASRPPFRKPAHQWRGIDFIADRGIGGDDGARCDLERQAAFGDGLGGSSRSSLVSVAFCEGLGGRSAFDGFAGMQRLLTSFDSPSSSAKADDPVFQRHS